MRWISRLICIATTLILAGCSSVQLAYNNAPFLVQYQLDSYLDLSDEQEQALRVQTLKLRQWHQAEALPVYASTLRDWAQSLARVQPWTAQEIMHKQDMLQDAALTFAQRGASELGPILITLTPRQRTRLAQRFETSNREYEQEYLRDPEQGRSKRRERFIKNYERWLGSVTAPQSAMIDQWLLDHPNDSQDWAQERKARQARLLELIDQADQFAGAQAAAVALNQYFESLATYQIPTLQAAQQDRRQALASLSAEILNSMTAQQRQHLRDELLSYAADFDALAARADRSALRRP